MIGWEWRSESIRGPRESNVDCVLGTYVMLIKFCQCKHISSVTAVLLHRSQSIDFELRVTLYSSVIPAHDPSFRTTILLTS